MYTDIHTWIDHHVHYVRLYGIPFSPGPTLHIFCHYCIRFFPFISRSVQVTSLLLLFRPTEEGATSIAHSLLSHIARCAQTKRPHCAENPKTGRNQLIKPVDAAPGLAIFRDQSLALAYNFIPPVNFLTSIVSAAVGWQ
jgi:hypothetical protein